MPGRHDGLRLGRGRDARQRQTVGEPSERVDVEGIWGYQHGKMQGYQETLLDDTYFCVRMRLCFVTFSLVIRL